MNATSKFRSRSDRDMRAFLHDTTGSASIWNLFWVVGFLMITGIAVDSANAWRMRVMLQASADAAAHAGAAALLDAGPVGAIMDSHPDTAGLDGEDPREVAQAFARLNMPRDRHGEVLYKSNVYVGNWDSEDRRLYTGAVTPDAVGVRLFRAEQNENSLPTHLLRLAGFTDWDIQVVSVARIYRQRRAECVEPVLAAQALVEVQSNDVYVGICVYADADVSVETQEPWLSDEVVGLVDRLILSGATDVSLASLGSLAGDLLSGPMSSAEFSGLIEELRASADVVLTADLFKKAELVAGSTYYVECADNQTLYLPGDMNLSQIVLLSECPVKAAQDLSLYSTVVIENIEALNHIELTVDLGEEIGGWLEVGDGEHCMPGDGVKILIFVDFDTAARFTLFDPEFYPLGEALVAAHREDTEVDGEIMAHVGASVVGDVVANAGLDNLLGLCISAQYMLHADAVTLAQ